jgi:hypothetical protein
MPRRSAAELNVVKPATNPPSSRLNPPPILNDDERQLFVMLAAENTHLRRSDNPILAAYCMTATKVQELSRSDDVTSWEKALKMLVVLARTMRISQQSMRDPITVARQTRNDEEQKAAAALFALNGDCDGKPWEPRNGDDDDAGADS